MNKILSFLIAALMLFTLSVPALAADSGFSLPSSVSSSSSDDGDVAEEPEQEDGGEEDTVLYDENGFKITLKGMNLEEEIGIKLDLFLENNSDKDVIFQVDSVTVNGYMTTDDLWENVPAGKKSNGTLTIFKYLLGLAGVTEIADIEISFDIVEDGSYDDIVITEPISIKTDIADGFEYVYDDSGIPAYEDDNYRIIIKGLKPNQWETSMCLYFYVENNSDTDILLDATNVSVNGIMVTFDLWERINAGKHAISSMEFFNSTLEDNGIETIENIEMALTLQEYGTWADILTTDPISVDF